MSQSECVVCDFTVEVPDPVYETNLVGVKVPTQQYLGWVAQAAALMEGHLEEHTKADFVEALHKADAYIAELEEEVEQLRNVLTVPTAVGLVDKGFTNQPPLEIPAEWQQGLQAEVEVKGPPPSEENPRGLPFPNGRPSLRAPGRSGA